MDVRNIFLKPAENVGYAPDVDSSIVELLRKHGLTGLPVKNGLDEQALLQCIEQNRLDLVIARTGLEFYPSSMWKLIMAANACKEGTFSAKVARELGFPVLRTGVNADATALHATAIIKSIMEGSFFASHSMKFTEPENQWCKDSIQDWRVHPRYWTIVVVGYGDVGQRVAEHFSDLSRTKLYRGLQVAVVNPMRGTARDAELQQLAREQGVHLYTSLEEAVEKTPRGVFTFHVRSSDSTGVSNTGIVTRELLERIGPRGGVVNMSRREILGLTDEELADFLLNGKLGAYATDVHGKKLEGPGKFRPDSSLLKNTRYIPTPHSAGSRQEVAPLAAEDIVKSVVDCLHYGEIPRDSALAYPHLGLPAIQGLQTFCNQNEAQLNKNVLGLELFLKPGDGVLEAVQAHLGADMRFVAQMPFEIPGKPGSNWESVPSVWALKLSGEQADMETVIAAVHQKLTQLPDNLVARARFLTMENPQLIAALKQVAARLVT